ncbi:MAG: hypothetical protein KDK04_29370 [Candidatus Competibacteraceae bacterium]|nr:hypothetical protein [Candidatus Competibacteraceae bacterium]
MLSEAQKIETKAGNKVKTIKDKVVAITGAGSGMGRQLAYAMANKGDVLRFCVDHTSNAINIALQR